MEKAKLILEFLKTVIWPALILLVILVYKDDVKTLLQRTESLDAGPIKLKAGSGHSSDNALAQALKAPDIHFDLVKPESKFDCSNRARQALKQNGFLANGKEVGENDSLFYGYNQGYVGVVWCQGSKVPDLIAVAGADSKEAADKRTKLSASFSEIRR